MIEEGHLIGTAGTEYAALGFGGDPEAHTDCTEEYYGETWAAGGALITARAQGFAGFGLQNAAVAAGGREGAGSGDLADTEEYNGTSWAAGGALNAARQGLSGVGTQNAGLAMAGLQVCTCTEEYDGTAWATSNPLSLGRKFVSVGGTQNSAFAAGGRTPVDGAGAGTACTEHYNGTTWSAGSSLSNSRYSGAGGGTLTAGIVAGGYGGSPAAYCTITEEYTSYITSGSFGTLSATTVSGHGSRLQNRIPPNTVTSSVQLASDISGSFTSGFQFTGTISASAGTTASASFGQVIATTLSGDGGGLTNTIPPNAISSSVQIASDISGSFLEGFDDLSGEVGVAAAVWSAGGALITATNYNQGTGGSTAALTAGGIDLLGYITCTQEYNGSTWSAGGALGIARASAGMAGTQNAALLAGGRSPTFSKCSFSFWWR